MLGTFRHKFYTLHFFQFGFFFTVTVEFFMCFLILPSVDTTQWNMTFATLFPSHHFFPDLLVKPKFSNFKSREIACRIIQLRYVLSNYFVFLKCDDSFLLYKINLSFLCDMTYVVCKIIENYPLKQLNQIVSILNAYEEFEDTKGVIRICKSKNRQHNGQRKKGKRQTMIQEKLCRKLKIKQHEPH